MNRQLFYDQEDMLKEKWRSFRNGVLTGIGITTGIIAILAFLGV